MKTSLVKDSIGSFIDPAVFTLTDHMTVQDALKEARKYKNKIEPNLFVLTLDRKLRGFINVSDLISENPESEINAIMNTRISALHPETPVRSVLTRQEWSKLGSMPVVDSASVFLGVIKLESVRSILAPSKKGKEDPGEDTISALGKLYQIGLAGLPKSATDLRSGLKE